MPELSTWCRGCDSLCGVLADSENGRLTKLRGDQDHPVSRGWACSFGRAAPAQLEDSARLVAPKPGASRPAAAEPGWDTALADIARKLTGIVSAQGARSVGVLLGGHAARSQRVRWELTELQRSLGPIRLFEANVGRAASLEQAARLVLGRRLDLRADIARARHVLLLGGNQSAEGWGPGYAGTTLAQRLDGAGRKPGLTVAEPRRTRLARQAGTWLAIRPGTELYLLLGLCAVVLRSEWYDAHQVETRTCGLGALREALEPWSAARAATLCGVDPADVTGEALRFSRAATATVHLGAQAWGTPWSTLTAWAALTLQALTGNLLAPGGVFAHPGGLHPLPALERRPATELHAALGSGLRALICLETDPVSELPGPRALADALARLECLVCVDRNEHVTARMAHWALPGTHYLEQAELGFGTACDRHWLQWSAGLVVPPGDCRAPDVILRDLRGLLHAPLHGRFRAQLAAITGRRSRGASLPERRAVHAAALQLGLSPVGLERKLGLGYSHTSDDARGVDGGPVDRAHWATSHPAGRVELAPEPFVRALATHVPVTLTADRPLALLTSARRDPARAPWDRGEAEHSPFVVLHPSCGFEEGQRVLVSTPRGGVEVRVRLEPGQRPDVADLPVGQGGLPLVLVDPTHRDRWSGSCWTDGQPCRVESLSPSSAAPKPLDHSRA